MCTAGFGGALTSAVTQVSQQAGEEQCEALELTPTDLPAPCPGRGGLEAGCPEA